MNSGTEPSEWEREVGDRWVRNQESLDRWLAPLGALALEACDARSGHRVLDVGCGCGASALELARAVGPTGSVIAADLSPAMLERARERAAAAGFTLDDRLGDAAALELSAGSLDRVHSRFGVMFFEQPTVAFGRFAEMLKPGAGRMGFICWQHADQNAWATATTAATEPVLGPAAPRLPGPGPFAFADADALRALLSEAGFVDVSVDGHETLLDAGRVDDAVALFGEEVGPAARRIREAEPDTARRALDALRASLAGDFADAAGRVQFPVAVWVVTGAAPRG